MLLRVFVISQVVKSQKVEWLLYHHTAPLLYYNGDHQCIVTMALFMIRMTSLQNPIHKNSIFICLFTVTVTNESFILHLKTLTFQPSFVNYIFSESITLMGVAHVTRQGLITRLTIL